MTKRLADVARKVGVSEATVSRVLNEKPGVSESTRQAVLTALDVLGYERPTKLRGERARLVGLVLPELQNPIFPAFAEVVGGALAQQGYTPVLCTQTAGGVSEADYVDLLLQQQVSGVVFAGGLYAQADAPHDHYAPARRARPADGPRQRRRSTASASRACRATTRSRSSRRWATCISLGHTRIGLLAGPARPRPVAAASSRAAQAVAQRRPGIALGPDHVAHSLYSLEAAQAGRGPAARGAASPASSAPATRWPSARSAPPAGPGCSVPGDVSVVGFDDSALMNCTEPPLTTVRQPIEPMGRMVIELLIGQIGGHAGPARRAALRARARRPRLDRARSRPALTARPATAASRIRARRLSRSHQRIFLSSSCIHLSDALRCSPRRDVVASRSTIASRLSEDRRDRTGPRRPGRAPLAACRRGRRRRPRRRPAPRRPDVVARRRHLRGLRPQLRRRQRRRDRRPRRRPRRGSPTCATSASTRSGSRPGTSRRSPTAATTSPTTGRSTRPSARSRRPRRSSPRRSTLGIRTIVDIVPNHVSDRHAWFQAALAAGPGSPERDAVLVPPGPRRRTATSRRPAGGPSSRARRGRRTTEPRRHARRVVPAPVHGRAARPQLGPPRRPRASTRRSCASGSTAAPPASASTRRRCWSRTRRCPRSRPSPRPGEHPHTRPRRAARHLPRLARDRRRLPGHARPRRRGLAAGRRALRPLPAPGRAAHRLQLRLHGPALGRRRACATSIDATLAAHAPVGAPATWVLSNHDVTRPVTRYGRADTVVRLRPQAVRAPRPTSSSGDAGPAPPRSSPPPCPARSTSTRATSSASTRSRSRSTRSRTRCTPARAASTPAATAAACRCPGAATRAPFGFSPAGRDRRAMAHASPPTGPR